eukprot:m.424465 g.424465  ORF g.424465 m.424465 type:complete len:329 (+) comp46903_c0_seq1:113-1099(+)
MSAGVPTMKAAKNEKVPAPAPLMVSGNVGVGRLNLDTAIAQSCGLAFSVAGVKGLFQNFHSAATALRIAWHVGEIHEIESDSDTPVARFFDELDVVEQSLIDGPPPHLPFYVVVEGLDGSGKSSVVKAIAQSSDEYRSARTPPENIDNVRSAFDRCGGSLARAFYMVSNYILQANMWAACRAADASVMFVVDRMFCTTCAYTVGWRNTEGGAEAVDVLPDVVFRWPTDLQPPNLVLILSVDDTTRRERVEVRNALTPGDPASPWDSRLSEYPDLPIRIMQAFMRMEESLPPGTLAVVDANRTRDEVRDAVLDIVHGARLTDVTFAASI